MKLYKGSFTIEAAFVFPIVLICIFIAIESGISLYDEVRTEAVSQMNKNPLDVVNCMYRREYVKDLFGELYED